MKMKIPSPKHEFGIFMHMGSVGTSHDKSETSDFIITIQLKKAQWFIVRYAQAQRLNVDPQAPAHFTDKIAPDLKEKIGAKF